MFSFNPSTNEILLRASFGNPNDLTDGSVPLSGLFAAPNGLYYGTCSEGGGVPNRGRVFSFNPANNVLAGLYNFQAGTDGGNPTSGFILVPPAPSAVFLDLTVLLDGPYDEGSQLMTDQLRQQGLVPLTEPYTAAGFTQVGGGGETVAPSVLNTTGNNAIVDWVFLELRSAGDNTNVLATRSALLQRDGNVVDVDGVSPVAFQGLGPGNYFLAVRHRNHLGVMTASTLAFSANPVTVDLTSGTTATFGTNARRVRGSERTLWAGNTLPDDIVKYNAAPNDRAAILAEVGGTVLTATATGYLVEDANLDGVVSYSGAGNDSDVVLRTIDGVDPGATRAEQLP